MHCFFLQSILTSCNMSRPLLLYRAFAVTTALLPSFINAQTPASGAADGLASASVTSMSGGDIATISGTTTSYRSEFTVPSEADIGANLIPNIADAEAVNAQVVCPGYTASDVVRNDLGFSAKLSLAGDACNVYGNDIDTLNLTVEYQSADRLAVRVMPAVLDSANQSYYILPDYLVHQPTADVDANTTSLENDLSFTWTNDPSFQFTVYRVSTGDAIFSTAGTKLIYEDQFIEFASELPENYNIYGLGETIRDFRQGNNYTKTMWAADIGDTIDA